MQSGVTDSLSAFQIDIATMLQENTSLEDLSINSWNESDLKAEKYGALVTSLQQNKPLKRLRIHHYGTLQLTDAEDKRMAKILKKNYASESLRDICLRKGDVGAILRLNAAGRRYLIEDRSSVSKGVEVLSAVRSNMDCVV